MSWETNSPVFFCFASRGGVSNQWWWTVIKTPAFAFALVLACGAFAQGQEEEPNGGDPIPLPFTRSALKGMYKTGLLLRYVRTTYQQGKAPRQEFVFNRVVEHSGKGYLVRTLVFNDAGNAIGKPSKPQAVPYQVESKTFRSAKVYKYEQIRLGRKEHTAHKYAYQVKLANRPGWRTVWYSGKYRGLLLKTMSQPTGEVGRKNYQTLELVEIPAKLRGQKEKIGGAQGNLPWTDEEILKAWPEGGWVEFEVKTKNKQGKQTLRLKRTMIGREASCYVVREQLWDAKGKLKGDTGRPRLWVTWLRDVRSAPKSVIKKKLDREVEAAGRKWPCKVYSLEGKQKITWYLSKEVPGLTVRYVSDRAGQKVDRLLSKVGIPLPGGK